MSKKRQNKSRRATKSSQARASQRKRQQLHTNRATGNSQGLRAKPRSTPYKIGKRLNHAYDLIDAGELFEAREILGGLPVKYENTVEVLHCYATLLRQLGNADAYLRKVSALNRLCPHDGEATLMLAGAFMGCGYPALARAECEHLKVSSFTNLEQVQVFEKIKSDAVSLSDEFAHNAFGDRPNALALVYKFEVTRLDFENGKFDEATPSLEELVKEVPSFTPALNNLALSYYHTGNMDEAYELLLRALKSSEENAFAWSVFVKVCTIMDRAIPKPPFPDRICQHHFAQQLETYIVLKDYSTVCRLFEQWKGEGDMQPDTELERVYHFAAYAYAMHDDHDTAQQL